MVISNNQIKYKNYIEEHPFRKWSRMKPDSFGYIFLIVRKYLFVPRVVVGAKSLGGQFKCLWSWTDSSRPPFRRKNFSYVDKRLCLLPSGCGPLLKNLVKFKFIQITQFLFLMQELSFTTYENIFLLVI